MLTLEQAQTDLVAVETAWTELLKGKRVSRLSLGTGSSRRDYTSQEINQTLLMKERDRLQKLIAAWTNEKPVYRNSSVCHTRHRKV
jgi:hypothetical protein